MAESGPTAGVTDAPVQLGGARKRTQGLIAVMIGLAMMLALFVAGLVLIPRYRAAHPASPLQRSDADRVQIDDMYLDLTLATPKFSERRRLTRYLEGRDPKTVLPVLVGVNTHTGSIEHMHHLSGDFVLVGPDGSRYPSLTSPIVVSQHHNAYMVLFPSRGNHGEVLLDQTHGKLAVEASGIGHEKLRRFEWPLPIDPNADVSAASRGPVAWAMLVVALLGALVVVLSPCALELSMYYSAIISCTVAEGGDGAGDSARLGQRRLMMNLGSFVAGFTLLYAASGATVGLIGQGVRRPLGAYGNVFQILGGSLIMLFALRVLALDGGLGSLSGRLLPARVRDTMGAFLARPRRLLARLKWRGRLAAEKRRGLTPRDSFLVGIGLSTSCLGCMGGAVLYPLLVYAGITSWYSGLITLGLYSLGIAVPMAFIALGFFQIRVSLAGKVRANRILRTTSGVLLAGVALLMVSGKERILTDLVFRALGGMSRWIS